MQTADPPLQFEVEGAAIVLVGDFNPTIFQPAWLSTNGLIRPEEAQSADIKVIHHDLADFSADWLHLIGNMGHVRLRFDVNSEPTGPVAVALSGPAFRL